MGYHGACLPRQLIQWQCVVCSFLLVAPLVLLIVLANLVSSDGVDVLR